MINLLRIPIFLGIFILAACSNKRIDQQAFFHADAHHTGFYNSRGLEMLKGVKWRFKTGGPVVSSPVIAGDRVIIGCDDGFVYALDTANGSLAWMFKTGGRVSSTAAISGGRVYFISFDGYVYCLDLESGKEIWRFKTAGECVFAAPGIHGLPEKDRILEDPWDVYLSSPVVGDGKVYLGCGKGIFYALDEKTGHEIWNYSTDGVIHASPAIDDSTVYFGSWDSYFYALNIHNGKLRWKFKTGIDTVNYNQVGFQSSPAICDGMVYSGCRDAYVRAIDAKTGELKWKYYNNGSWVVSTPAVHNDTLYFTTSDSHRLIALNRNDGSELYVGNIKTYGYSSPSLTSGMIYVGTFGGSLMAFKSSYGKAVWEYQSEPARINADTILNDKGEFNFPKVFTENSYAGMCKAVKTLYSLGAVLSTPAVANGVVYLGSTSGNVFALH